MNVIDAKRDKFMMEGIVGKHDIFNNAGKISMNIHENKGDGGIRGEFFEEQGSVMLGLSLIHFKDPSSSLNSWEFAVGNNTNLNLNFVMW